MEGVIVCIKHNSRVPIYYVGSISDSAILLHAAESAINTGIGELVASEGGRITKVKDFGAGAYAYLSRLRHMAEEHAEKSLKPKPFALGIEGLDAATERMWPALRAAAALFLRKLLLGAPIIVRFHNDADGSSGAYSIHSGMKGFIADPKTSNVIWIMHKGVSYSVYDAESDRLILNSYESVEKPLLLIIDFGTTQESSRGISKALEHADMIVLDHHPLPEGFSGENISYYINPWIFDSDSNYTAGILSSMFARAFSDISNHDMECASLIGDHSIYASNCKEGSERAMLLDLVTSEARVTGLSSAWGITPQYIDSILNDRQKYDELLRYAKTRLDDTLSLSLKKLKAYSAGGVKIYLLDYDSVRSENTGFPLPGRFATKLLDTIKGIDASECILILHMGQYISIRVSAGIGEKVQLLGMINELRERHASAIESGGGHRNAASIKVSALDSKKAVLQDLVAMAKKALDV